MRRKYDDDFKRNAVQKVLDGQSAVSVARELGIGENLIYRWKKDFLKNGNGHQTGEQLQEIEALKKRNRELEQELEIIKKAALIFGKEKR